MNVFGSSGSGSSKDFTYAYLVPAIVVHDDDEELRKEQRAIVSHDGESSCESSDSYARAVPFRPFTCAHHAV